MSNTSRILAACTAVLSFSISAQTGGILRFVEQWSVRTGWAMSADDSYLGSRAGCYESLTKVDFDGQLKPSLATSWAQTAPTTWEFKIREGVKFHDGTALSAESAANALNQLLKAAVPARAFSSKFVKAVEATDSKTVKITLAEPSVLLPGQLASPATAILAPSAYKDGKVNPINACTGPFVITRVDPTQGMTVKRNDAYWGEKPVLAGAEIKFILDANGRATQMRTGEADVSRVLPTVALAQVKSSPGLQVSQVPAPRTLMMLLNNKKAPLNDIRVRQAIQAAIDNSAIAGSVFEGLVTGAMGPFRPSDPWAPKDQKPAYNLDKAKKLLADAGIRPGTLKLSLWGYTARSEMKDVAAVIQEMLGKVGIGVEIRIAEYNAIEPDMLAGKFDMALMSRGYLTDVPEPIGFLNADYTCGGSYNMSQYCSPEVDAEIKSIFATVDQAQRFDGYRKIAARMQAEATTVYLIHETAYDAYTSKVKNYKPHPMNYLSLTPSLGLN